MSEESDGVDGILVSDPNQPDAPLYRPFRSRPTGTFVQGVFERIKKTGQPELVVGLYRGRIDRSARFHILRKIEIDRRKRPNGDMAPCPRCGCEDKFLSGVLAWFPDLQFCAVIGHCCADHEALNEAEREFKWREKRDHEENILLTGLPKLAAKANALQQLRSSAGEALRVYRAFRKGAPAIHQHLRDLKAQRGGELKLVQLLSGPEKEGDYHGPAGFGGRGASDVESRDINFGLIAGQAAVSKDYNPIKELDETLRVLDSFDVRPTEEEALDLIVKMTERERYAAVVILQSVDKGFANINRKLADFWSFFTRANVERLNAYGTHSENHLPFEAAYRTNGRRTLVTITHRRVECRLTFDEKSANARVDWPG